MKRFEIFFGVIKVPTDFIMTILAFLSAYKLRILTERIGGIAKPIDYSVLPTIREYLDFSTNAALALIVIFALGKMYTIKTTSKFGTEIKKIILLCVIWAGLIITYFFFTRTFPFSRLATIYSWILTFLFIIFGRGIIRLIQKILLKIGIGRRNLLLIGNNDLTKEIKENLSRDKSYKIIGIIGEKNPKTNLETMGSISQLQYIIKTHHIDEILQTQSNIAETQSEEILELCDINHINYRFVPDLIDVRRTNIEIETLGTIPIITLKSTPLDGWGKVAKRISDIIGGTFGLIILSPIFLFTAIAIKIDSKGPIIFSKLDNGQSVKRVGEHGKLFNFYKFRSMHPNTDNLRYTQLKDQNLRTDGPLIKIKDDPRITRVGKFLRKYSLDELPQLFSVLKGDMSLVGPRPHLPEEVSKYENKNRFVLTIKPGITGIPQTSGRSDLKFEDEVKLDRYYIENWSIWLDIKTILKTLGTILKGYKE